MARENEYLNEEEIPEAGAQADTQVDTISRLPDDASDDIPDEISLESILAEYKGSAYIDGDKRTPSALLNEKTQRIVMEVTGTRKAETEFSSSQLGGKADQDYTSSLSSSKAMRDALAPLTRDEQAERGERPLKAETKVITLPEQKGARVSEDTEAKKKITATEISDKDVVFFEDYRYASPDHYDEVVKEVSEAIEKQTQMEEENIKSVKKAFHIFGRDDDGAYDEEDHEPARRRIKPEPPIVEEEVFDEPDYRSAAKRFAKGCNSLSLRSMICLFLSLIMAVFTYISESGKPLPFGIGQEPVLHAGILLIMQLIVMTIGVDILVRGVMELTRGKPGAETLVLFSSLATAASAAYSIYLKDTAQGLPICVVSAFAVTFTLWGEKLYMKALTETMKTAIAASAPFGVIAERYDDLNRTLMKKVSGRISGFYNNLVQEDISETVYRFAAPILIIASLVLAFYSSVGHGKAEYFLYNFAAIIAAGTSFSSVFAFSVPFSSVARRARQSGAAIAGWGGADDIFHSDGTSITDDDLFPTGTLSLNGIKIFEEVSPEKAIRYTSSLIMASGSGLAAVFSEVLKKQAMNLIRVDDFACYEGGIGGTIKNERVITGSGAFMNLMGIRVPSSMNMKNAVFTAVNDKLIAVFAINYIPSKSVQNALVSILRYKVKLFFAVRDFNITPLMLEQKFKVPVDVVEYIPIQHSYSLSDEMKSEAKRVTAILSREGLGPYVESITGGRRLRTTALIATIFTMFSSAAGALLMFLICWTGAYDSASAGNLLLYMGSMLLAVLIICGFAKYKQ
jgi:hypothetical protein